MVRFKSIKRWLSLALCLGMCLSLLPETVLAIDPIDQTKPTSLTLAFAPGGKALQGVTFQVYRVGDPDDFCAFAPVEPFTKYEVQINDLDSAGWKDLATTLAGYVARDGIRPTKTAVTDANGKAVFENLENGLYLVTGSPKKSGNYTYTPAAVMVSLPNRDQEDQWRYHVSADVKYEEDYNPGSSGSKTSVKVQKIWADTDHQGQRPSEVVVQLLRDGVVYQTVTLNADNNWRHTWSNLSKHVTWQVVEKDVPDGYTVSVSQDGTTSFVVTNTYEVPDHLDPPDDPDDPPSPPDKPDSPDTPDEPEKEPDKNPDKKPQKETLPQTGMLWWPVPLLAVGGMGCFLAGWVKNRKENGHEE